MTDSNAKSSQHLVLSESGETEVVVTAPAPLMPELSESTHVGTTGTPENGSSGAPVYTGTVASSSTGNSPGTPQSRQASAAPKAQLPKQEIFKFPPYVLADSLRVRESVDYSKLVTNDEGQYSTILPYYTTHVARILRKYFPSLGDGSRIYDATANIGGDSINFVHNFPGVRVTAVEVNRDNVEVLERNVEAVGFGAHIECVEANCLTDLARYADGPPKDPYDFVYFDPPWGGPHVWKARRFMMLNLAAPGWAGASAHPAEEVPIYEAVSQVFAFGVSRAVVLKAPQNFDIKAFTHHLSRGGHKCTIDRETVRKKARGRRPAAVAYLMYVVRLEEKDDDESAEEDEEDPGRTASSDGKEAEDDAVTGGLFATLGAWLESETRRDHDGARFVLARTRLFLTKRLHRAPSRTIRAAEAIITDAARKRRGDGETLAALAKLCAPFRAPPAAADRQQKGRASSRIADIIPTLKDTLTHAYAPEVRDYLDIGCAEGGLTTAFGEALELDEKHVHGCDVLATAPGAGFEFTTARAERLPYDDDQFQVISFIMALHHIKDLRSALAEAQRVLAPGGILVIREHDCRSKHFGLFLDLVHFLYAAVVDDEIVLRPDHEDEDFEVHRARLTSTFRTKETWSAELDRAGFTFVCKRDPVVANSKGQRRLKSDIYNSYYAFYRK